MALLNVALSHQLKLSEGLQVFLAVTPTLLLCPLVVREILANENPPLPVRVQQRDELYTLLEGPEVRFFTLGFLPFNRNLGLRNNSRWFNPFTLSKCRSWCFTLLRHL